MSDYMATIIGIFLTLLYIFGMYEIVVDDQRYTTKDVVIGAFFFPYPWWVGGKEIYRIATISSADREAEEKCLNACEAMGMPRKARLRFCKCIIETHNSEDCKYKILEGQ